MRGLHHIAKLSSSKCCCSGPTSFAPAINKAMEIVRLSGGRFHILLLIADGQVIPGQCMENTKRAIVEASRYPMSIIMVGVGDGAPASKSPASSGASSWEVDVVLLMA